MLFCNGTQATELPLASVIHLPKDTIVLKFSEENEWKEINRYVNEVESFVDRIPIDQNTENWTELIALAFFKKSPTRKIKSIDSLVAGVFEHIEKSYQGKKISYKVLEKNNDDFIYEWALHEPCNDTPAQHEVLRVFFTDTGIHQIGFTRKHRQMTQDEKEKWIKLFRESASIQSMTKAKNIQGFSLVDKLKYSIDLGSDFIDWPIVETQSYERNGLTTTRKAPPSYERKYLLEYLEIMSAPAITESTIDQKFISWKEFFSKMSRMT